MKKRNPYLCFRQIKFVSHSTYIPTLGVKTGAAISMKLQTRLLYNLYFKHDVARKCSEET
jgi:hypothetical protein